MNKKSDFIIKLNKELNSSELSVKNEILKNYKEKQFKKYGILNKDWIEEYKNIFNENETDSINKNIFDIKKLTPNFDNREIIVDINNKIIVNFPKNFFLVSENVINLLEEYFSNKEEQDKMLTLIYEVIIGGHCIIIKDKHYNSNLIFISLYNSQNDTYISNTIDYVINYFSPEYMNEEVNLIISQNISNYLKYKTKNIFYIIIHIQNI